MLTFVVMPCLNEADLIAQTVSSLGFSREAQAPEDTHLIAVDNGSTDGTVEILERIRSQTSGHLHLFHEPIRGYVPPRRLGVSMAEMLASKMGQSESNVLILQADADTTYKKGYVEAMQAAAQGVHNVILEGATRHPPEFAERHPKYVAAERMVDSEIEALDAEDEDEVVVDDKACGYRLSDYLIWGGLFEEHSASGDAIHAETTRMFIRAKLMHGAKKRRVNPAGAASSRRRVAENPWLYYATVGFPRETSWLGGQSAHMHTGTDIDRFAQDAMDGREPRAVFLRQAHQLALFRFLPALVALASGRSGRASLPIDVGAALNALPSWSRDDLARQPGKALTQILNLIDSKPDLFRIPPSLR